MEKLFYDLCSYLIVFFTEILYLSWVIQFILYSFNISLWGKELDVISSSPLSDNRH